MRDGDWCLYIHHRMHTMCKSELSIYIPSSAVLLQGVYSVCGANTAPFYVYHSSYRQQDLASASNEPFHSKQFLEKKKKLNLITYDRLLKTAELNLYQRIIRYPLPYSLCSIWEVTVASLLLKSL